MSYRLLCSLGEFHFLLYCLRIPSDVTLHPAYPAFKKKLPRRLANNPSELREWWSHRRWVEAVHLVSVITGRTEGWGQASTAGCGRLPRTCLWVLGSGKPDSWGGYMTACPSPALLTLGFFLWSVFFLISDLCPSSHINTRWPVRIEIKALGGIIMSNNLCSASSFGFSDLYYVGESARNTPGIYSRDKMGLENRGHHVHDPSNWASSVIFNFQVVLVHLILY